MSSTQTPDVEKPLPHVPVVLLCAEDDDLELVSFVHLARQRGLEPEVVTGVDEDDRPLLDAVAENETALFVALRSENLDQPRTLALKRLFARHAKKNQKLLALRLEPSRSEHAVQVVARRLRALASKPGSADLAVATSPRSTSRDDGDEPWGDRTVVADHVPRPPAEPLPATDPSIEDETTSTEEPWGDRTVVADHVPRPPADVIPTGDADEETPSSGDRHDADDRHLEDSLELAISDSGVLDGDDEQPLANATASAGDDTRDRPMAPVPATQRGSTIGYWLALGLLLLAAWKAGPMILSSCESPAVPATDESEPACIDCN